MRQLLYVLLLTVAVYGCQKHKEYTPCDAQAEPCVWDLYEKLLDLRNKGVMVGHQDDLMYGHSWEYERGRSDVKEVCGSYPAVMGWDLGGIELGNSCNIDDVPFDFMRKAVAAADSMGCVNTFSWHMRNPVTGGSSWDLSGGNVVREVLPGGSCHELYKEWTDRCVEFLKSLKDQEGNSIPVVYRPYHENTGGAFWWGALSCEPADYIELWHWTVDYMYASGVHNLLYAYSTDIFWSEQEYMLRYPGDEWVDIMGWDAYHRPQDWDFLEGMTMMATTVSSLAASHHKLAALTETGLESVCLDNWWTEYLLPSVRGYDLSWVLLWRNSQNMPDHYFGPFKGHKTESDFIKFVNQEDILVVNEIK